MSISIIKIDEHDRQDLLDLIGDLSLSIHFIFGSRINDFTRIDKILDKISSILHRYAPQMDELARNVDEFKTEILHNPEVNPLEFFVLYDAFEHDLLNFVDYATNIGFCPDTKHILYEPTHQGIAQIIKTINGKEDENQSLDDIFDY